MSLKPATQRRSTADAAGVSPADFNAAYDAKAYGAARRIIEALLRREPDRTDRQIAHAYLLYSQFGEVDQPIEILRSVLRREPDDPKVLTMLATIHMSVDQREQALAFARRCVEVSPETPDAYLTVIRACPEESEAIGARIETLLRDHDPTDAQRVVFHWALGKIHDRLDDVDRAFAHFTEASRLRPGRYDPALVERRFAHMSGVFDAEFFPRRRRLGASDTRPVFIVGMPRSGSTLLERILGRHPQVDMLGERTEMATLVEDLRARRRAPPPGAPGCCDWFADLGKTEIRGAADRWSALVRPALKHPNARRWIDKMPGNFMLAGFIALALPKARLLHARRDPLDTALSCFTQSFFEGHVYARDLPALAHYLAVQRRYMAHWRAVCPAPILEVRYEDVVADLESQARRALDHLDLDWSDACLTPRHSDRAVLTASIDQVRKPIYDSSVGKWRRYRRHLAPLLDTWRAMGGETLDAMLGECVDPPEA